MSDQRISTRKKKKVYNEDFDYNQMKRRKKDSQSIELRNRSVSISSTLSTQQQKKISGTTHVRKSKKDVCNESSNDTTADNKYDKHDDALDAKCKERSVT